MAWFRPRLIWELFWIYSSDEHNIWTGTLFIRLLFFLHYISKLKESTFSSAHILGQLSYLEYLGKPNSVDTNVLICTLDKNSALSRTKPPFHLYFEKTSSYLSSPLWRAPGLLCQDALWPVSPGGPAGCLSEMFLSELSLSGPSAASQLATMHSRQGWEFTSFKNLPVVCSSYSIVIVKSCNISAEQEQITPGLLCCYSNNTEEIINLHYIFSRHQLNQRVHSFWAAL